MHATQIRPQSRMNRYFGLASLTAGAVLLAMMNPAAAQDLPPNWPPKGQGEQAGPIDENAPRLVFDELKHNFGRIRDRAPVVHSYRFTNVGGRLVTIEKVKPSCGCTTTELAIKDYLPGESGFIELSFDPRNRHGVQHKTVKVTSNDPHEPEIVLEFEADIDPVIKFDQRYSNLGQLIKGKSDPRTIKVTSSLPKFEVKSLEISGEGMQATVKSIETIEDREGNEIQEATIEIVVDPSTPRGYFSRGLKLVGLMTDEEGEEFEQVSQFSVSANVVGDIEASPTRVGLGRLEPGESFERQIRLRSRTGQQFDIVGIELKEDTSLGGITEVNVELEVSHDTVQTEAGELMHRVKVSGEAPDKAGRFFGFVIVKTNLPDDPEVELRYFGLVAN
ncbi:MAG: DUF1573 domain-containing protein [Planctomycetes bacterium]|nr:DUF1573 domain-containing protein [Planctomycetota bacterium]